MVAGSDEDGTYAVELAPFTTVAKGIRKMRKITSTCIAVVLATVIVGTWAMTNTTANTNGLIDGPAAMTPFEMMTNTKDLPVDNIVDAV